MVIFHSYVKLPEGISGYSWILIAGWWEWSNWLVSWWAEDQEPWHGNPWFPLSHWIITLDTLVSKFSNWVIPYIYIIYIIYTWVLAMVIYSPGTESLPSIIHPPIYWLWTITKHHSSIYLLIMNHYQPSLTHLSSGSEQLTIIDHY